MARWPGGAMRRVGERVLAVALLLAGLAGLAAPARADQAGEDRERIRHAARRYGVELSESDVERLRVAAWIRGIDVERAIESGAGDRMSAVMRASSKDGKWVTTTDPSGNPVQMWTFGPKVDFELRKERFEKLVDEGRKLAGTPEDPIPPPEPVDPFRAGAAAGAAVLLAVAHRRKRELRAWASSPERPTPDRPESPVPWSPLLALLGSFGLVGWLVMPRVPAQGPGTAGILPAPPLPASPAAVAAPLPTALPPVPSPAPPTPSPAAAKSTPPKAAVPAPAAPVPVVPAVDPKDEGAIARALGSRDPAQIRAALAACAKAARPPALRVLAGTLLESPEPTTLPALVAALAKHPHPDSKAVLAHLARQAGPAAKAAREALRAAGGHLAASLPFDEAELRAASEADLSRPQTMARLRGLALMEGKEVTELLRTLAKDPAEGIRKAAKATLADRIKQGFVLPDAAR